MATCGCWDGVLLTALAALVVLPLQYWTPALRPGGAEEPPAAPAEPAPHPTWLQLAHVPPLELLATLVLLLVGLFTYLCEWIHRKIMERRIDKLKQYVVSSVERLLAWERQQEQLERSLQLVQRAAAEYDLLLWLLLRHHPPAFHDKQPLHFLNTAVDV